MRLSGQDNKPRQFMLTADCKDVMKVEREFSSQTRNSGKLIMVFIFEICWTKTLLMEAVMKATVALSIAAIGLGLMSCGDDKTTSPGPSPSPYRSVAVNLDGMDPHVGQFMRFDVASGQELISRAVLDPLPAASFDFVVKQAVPEGAFRFDFFADLNGNGSYNPPPADHAWRLVLPDTGLIVVNFTHNTEFTDISDTSTSDSGSEFRIDCTDFTPHVGQLLELKVVRAATGRTVGYYRLDAIPGPDFDLEIRDIIKTGEDYRVDFYADLNGNGRYDAPPVDHAWRLTGTGTAAGLSLTFAHNTSFTDIDF